jgi:hypothetical protein
MVFPSLLSVLFSLFSQMVLCFVGELLVEFRMQSRDCKIYQTRNSDDMHGIAGTICDDR